MEERNVIGPAAGAAYGWVVDFYSTLGPFILLALALILVDFRFGVKKAKMNDRDKIKNGIDITKEDDRFRASRAVRRSLNKVVDYLCWITIAGLIGNSFGTVFGIPYASAAMLLLVYGIEINSCYNNYLEVKGIKKKFNVFKLFQKKLDVDITEALEDKE
jgi:hypothetical protein